MSVMWHACAALADCRGDLVEAEGGGLGMYKFILSL